MLRVVRRLVERHPERTVFTRFIPPPHAEDARGSWRRYFERWRELLRRRNVENLVISGAETDVCVLAAVMDAIDRGYRLVLATDAICSSSDETHDALLSPYRWRFSEQTETADTETILSCWQ